MANPNAREVMQAIAMLIQDEMDANAEAENHGGRGEDEDPVTSQFHSLRVPSAGSTMRLTMLNGDTFQVAVRLVA